MCERGRIKIWMTNPDVVRDTDLLAEYRSLLSIDELEKQRRFHHSADRHRYLVTRVLARTVLARYTGIPAASLEFTENTYGKPAVSNAGERSQSISFNISHTQGLIVLGVAQHNQIGVDIENYSDHEPLFDLADQFFGEKEIADLSNLPSRKRSRRFFELWTLKESYIKARGMGLSIPLDAFSFEFSTLNRIRFYSREDLGGAARTWQFWQFQPTRGLLGAICAEKMADIVPRLTFVSIVPLDQENLTYPTTLRTPAE